MIFLQRQVVESTQPLKTSSEIAAWLDKMKVKGYEIDEDLFVNVDGDVDLSSKNLTSIPVKFGAVGGDFICSYNRLTSLTGSPQEVGGNFNCSNNRLTSLTGAPHEVGGDFYCSFNSLTSLTGGPREVGGNFLCYNNKFKEELDHSFINIEGEFNFNI